MDLPLDTEGFAVHLENFDGPFDLLLSLIGKRKLDVTEIALAAVTDEFITYMRAGEDSWNLDQASHFLMVAATLLDLKAARLLPSAEVEDAEDIAALEARDLLFARLLQYRAFKQVGAFLGERLEQFAGSLPREVGLEPHFAALLPALIFPITPAQLAACAAGAIAPRTAPVVDFSHVHVSRVSVRQEAAALLGQIRTAGIASFRQLTAGKSRDVVVVRFLGLLELYRLGAVLFDQAEPLADLMVRWAGHEDGEYEITDPQAEYAQGEL